MARERLCVCERVCVSGVQESSTWGSASLLSPLFQDLTFLKIPPATGSDMDLIKPSGWGMHTEPRCLSALHRLQKRNTTAQVTATSTKHLKAQSWNASKCHTFLFFLLPLSVLAFSSFFSPLAYLDCLFGFFPLVLSHIHFLSLSLSALMIIVRNADLNSLVSVPTGELICSLNLIIFTIILLLRHYHFSRPLPPSPHLLRLKNADMLPKNGEKLKFTKALTHDSLSSL